MTKKIDDSFSVIELHIDDIKEQGYDTSKLTVENMEWFARKMSDSCMDNFWESLEYFAEKMELPKVKN